MKKLLILLVLLLLISCAEELTVDDVKTETNEVIDKITKTAEIWSDKESEEKQEPDFSSLKYLENKLIDRFGRTVNYLRMSITDRCDLRCVYCMAEEMEFLPPPRRPIDEPGTRVHPAR